MNDNIHVILQALGKMFQAELVIVSSLSEKRNIERDITKLSVEKLGGGMIVGESFYDHINSKITISQGACDAEHLCKQYVGGEFFHLFRYEIQISGDSDDFMLCINSPRENGIFEKKDEEYLISKFDLDVKEWLAKLEKTHRKLFDR